MRKIQPHFIDTLDFSSISDIFTISASKRVINIPNCPTVNTVLDFLTSNAVNLPTSLLVFIFNILEPKKSTFDRQKLQILSEILQNQKSERIFVFQSKFHPTKFLCKIKNQVMLTKIELSRRLYEDEFTNFLITNVMIFKALVLSRVEDGICSVYDYSFSNIILDINRHFLGLKLVDYALVNFDSLSLKFLQLFGIDLNLMNENGDRPLETAAKFGNFCGFLELLGTNFDILTLLHQPTGYNLLMLAVENGNLEILQFLLELDVFDVNYCVKGQTALILAIKNEKAEAIKVLLEYDATYGDDIENDFTEDAIELHRLVRSGGVGHENQNQIQKILQKYPKTRTFLDSKGQSAMKTAIKFAIDKISQEECSTELEKVEKNWSNFIEFLLICGLRMGKSEEFPDILNSKWTVNPLYCDFIHKILSRCVIKNDNECSSQQIDANTNSNVSIEMTSSNLNEDKAKMSAAEEKVINEVRAVNSNSSNQIESADQVYRNELEMKDLISLEFEANSIKNDNNCDFNSNDGSDFELVDNSDTESLVCKFSQAKIEAPVTVFHKNSIASNFNQHNMKKNGNKILIEVLKMLAIIPETKIMLEIFGLYEDVTSSVDLSSLSFEIRENSVKHSKLDSKLPEHVKNPDSNSISSFIYSSSSEVSSLTHAMQSFNIISSASSTSYQVIDDDAESVGSNASDRTLNSFSSFENLSNVENISVCSDFEEIEHNLKNSEVNLVQNFESFTENLLPKIENVAQNLIEEIFNFVVFKTFNNNLKPFYENDEKSEIELNILAQEIHKKYLFGQIEENLIKNVFKNQNFLNWGRNLLACVPKMCILYAKNEKKLQENRQNLKELFKFYEHLMIVFENHLISTKFSIKIDNFNKFSNLFVKITKMSENFKWVNLDKFKNLNIFGNDFNNISISFSKCIQILITNSSILTLVQISKEVSKNSLIFVDFDTFLSEKFQNEVKKLLNQAYLVVSIDSSHKIETNLLDFEVMSKFPERILFIFETSDKELTTEQNIQDKIAKIFKNNPNFEVIMPQTYSTAQKLNQKVKIQIQTLKLHHKVSDFTRNTKKIILEKDVDFQGSMIKFSALISSEILKEIDERSFRILIDNKEILKVGQKLTKSDKFYFDRKFVDSYYIYIAPHIRNVSCVDSTNYFLELLNQKIVLLCDEPGMGKSTTLKQLQFKFKEVFPSSWVIYVDLKRHASIYEDFKDIQQWNYKNFTKFFTKIQNLSEFEGTIFHELLLTEKVIFLIDGVDEITQKHKEFMINFTKDLYKITNCYIWIGMRPHCINEYRGAFNIFAYHLEPIDSQKFLDTYVKSQNITENVETNLRTFVQKFKNFNKSCSNPLLISIVLDIYDQLGTELGFYMIYEKYVWKKFGIDGETDAGWLEKLGNLVDNSPVRSNKKDPQNLGIIQNPNRFYESKPSCSSAGSSRVQNTIENIKKLPKILAKKWISVGFTYLAQEPPTNTPKLSKDLKLLDNSDSDSYSSEKDRITWSYEYGDVVSSTQATVVDYSEEKLKGKQQLETEFLYSSCQKEAKSKASSVKFEESLQKSKISDPNLQNFEVLPQKSGTLDEILLKSEASQEKLKNFSQIGLKEEELVSQLSNITKPIKCDKSIPNVIVASKASNKSLKNISKILKLIKLHQRLALKKFILFVANLGLQLNLEEANISFTDSEIVKLSSYDIVYGTTNDQVFFIHQTFYEFFIANFVVGKIFESPETNQDPVISTIFSIIFTYCEFEVIAKFINFYVKDNENEILARNNQTFKHIMKYIPLLGTVVAGNSVWCTFDRNVHRFMALKHFDLARLVLKIFQNEDQMKKMFRKISSGENLMLLDVCSYSFSSKETLEFLSIFKNALSSKRQKMIFNYFIFFNFTFLKEILNKLSKNDTKKFFGIVEEIFTEDELTEIFKSQVNVNQDPNFCKFLRSIHMLSNDELTLKNLEIFLEFSSKFLDLDQKCLIVQNFAENLEISMSKNPKISKIFKTFMTNLEEPKIREILLYKNSKMSKIFLSFVSKKIKFSHFQFLMRLISENLKEIEIFNIIENHSNLKVEFLHACSQNMSKNIEIFANFIDKFLPVINLKEFLLQKDQNCQFSAVHFLFQNCNLNFERIFSKSEIKNLILTRNFKNETILFEIFRKEQKLSENFFNLMLEFLDKTELKTFLCHKNNDSKTAFQVFDDFLKNYELYIFSPRNFQKFLSENFEHLEVMEMIY